ncbi:outer membrane transport energization protein ExbD [Rhodobacter aestuarii]|uniref:Biopolymer transport protein ExbD n=1 Tax=Rhodobacter aestuarii TaxID=453582 RepID=A0A1N7JL40_9RHOB|nr:MULTISPECIES: TonB system transport protein ExbD [Rhodobacter]PTV96090.1 outer membrane transport energization protein ExbD [Rhodobacter aestuarii]SIS50083.1 outer membrane transport energization protein ExbD [Rhodobacter aestuarii]SOC09820.1 outer membrane transport energization protein ExbD [Rhodobacter sp. JA431]
MAGRLFAEDDLAPEAAINITPFIDVMLVLLIIFMVAAPLSTVDVPVDLPVASAAPEARPKDPVIVTLQADGVLLLGRDTLTAEALGPALESATEGDRSARIFLSADQAVAYGEIMALFDQMRAAGYLKIGLVGAEKAAP